MFTVIRMGLKLALFGGLVAGGGMLAVQHVPGLRANMYEVVNPRVKEARMLETLTDRVAILDATLAESGDHQGARKALAEVEALVAEITALNEEHAGVAEGIVTKLMDAVVSTPHSQPSSPGVSPAPSSKSSPSATVPTTVSTVATPVSSVVPLPSCTP